MKTRHTENLIIGFGKAGKTLAGDLARHGHDVMLAEESDRMYGGTCINVGCIPSKTLLVEGDLSARTADKREAFARAMARKEQLVTALRAANYAKLDALDRVTVINAKARFVDPHTVLLSGPEGESMVTADRIFINTGSRPARLDIEGAGSSRVFDSSGFLSLPFWPDRVVIIGGGYISLEFATMYNAFGCKVTILEAGDIFLAREDRDIADEMLRILTGKGIEVVTSAQTLKITDDADAATVVTNRGSYPADAVLVGIGRRPNTEGLDVEKAGVRLNERGFIVTDEHLQAAPHIWAMGDVAGSPQFTYVSLDDYRIVRDQLFGDGRRTRNDRPNLPTNVFTNPPLAQIGLTETQAQQSGKRFAVKKLKAAAIPKAKVLDQPDGILKAIVDEDSGLILGATLFCAEAHELVNLIKMAMDNHIPYTYIRDQIFTHPTIAEGLNDLFA